MKLETTLFMTNKFTLIEGEVEVIGPGVHTVIHHVSLLLARSLIKNIVASISKRNMACPYRGHKLDCHRCHGLQCDLFHFKLVRIFGGSFSPHKGLLKGSCQLDVRGICDVRDLVWLDCNYRSRLKGRVDGRPSTG
ncbi:hypothetical protein LINPERPRIM_LOCUS8284, partial [Linum perenne]